MALEDLDSNSSVGTSAMRRYGSTVGVALGCTTEVGFRLFDEDRVAILKQLVYHRLQTVVADPIRVFVKPEPHKTSKLEEGRLRLISAVSFTDTMCDRVMTGALARRILSMVGHTPVKIGWSPVSGGARLMTHLFAGCRTRGLDKTAWDWSIQPEILFILKDIFKNLIVGAPEFWSTWLDFRWEQLFRYAEFEFGDGSRILQPSWGLMKSGCYWTIILNSIGQLVYHVLACRRLAIHPRAHKIAVIGDDVTIEDFDSFDQYERIILEAGALLKPSEPSEIIQFAGFIYTTLDGVSVAYPEYWRKHVYAITHAPDSKLIQMLESYQLLYAYEPVMLEWIRMLLGNLSPGSVRDTAVLRFVFNG